MIERQELYCHACDSYVQFPVDLELDGNHVLKCPNCGHEHCRVVKDGKVTGERWDSRNGATYTIPPYSVYYTAVSTTTSTFSYVCSSTTAC